jgi:hypothetical protein
VAEPGVTTVVGAADVEMDEGAVGTFVVTELMAETADSESRSRLNALNLQARHSLAACLSIFQAPCK